MEYTENGVTENIPVDNLRSAREAGAAAGEAAVAELDAEEASGPEYSDAGDASDDESYPLHSKEAEDDSEKLTADNSTEDSLRTSGEALLKAGRYEDAGTMIGERALASDGEQNFRGRDAIVQAMEQQGLSLKGNEIWQGGRHVGNAKLDLQRNPMTDSIQVVGMDIEKF